MRVLLLVPSFVFQAYFCQRRIVTRFEDPHKTCTQTVGGNLKKQVKKLNIILLLTLVLQTTFGQTRVDELYLKAQEQIDNSHMFAALIYLDTIENLVGEVDSILALQAYCFVMQGQIEESIEKSKKALSINDKCDFAYFTFGLASSEHELTQTEISKIFTKDVLADVEKFSELSIEYRIEYGPYGMKVYDEKRAIRYLDTAISINPNNPDYFYSRGIKKSDIEDFDGALVDLNKAILIDSKTSFYYQERAMIFENKQDYQNALTDIDKAILLDSDDSYSYIQRGNLKYQFLDDKKGACDDLRKAALLGRYVPTFYNICE
ncbi:MAG: hypothetical protein JXQ87_17875 [Bacteroidia bacterium]